jgi:hypothetical protein
VSDSPDNRPIRPFADWLREQRKGNLASELGEALNHLADKVLELEKPGEITIKLKLAPHGEMIAVHDSMTLKVPEPDKPPSLYFVSEGNLIRTNPRQPDLPFARVADAQES